MGIASANSNSKIEDERKAAEKAKALLIGLTPASARTDRIISVLPDRVVGAGHSS